MSLLRLWRVVLVAALGAGSWMMTEAHAQSATTAEVRDGAHDFDYNIGIWKTHIRRLANPLSGSKDWVEMNGTVAVRKVWGGRAQLEEIEADGPNGHLEGLTLFLYDPAAHQWRQAFASSSDGMMEDPSIGGFKDGRGELYDRETYKGRAVLVRAAWSEIAPDSHHFELAFSDDGGKTWEPNFVASLTRTSTAKEPEAATAKDGHDFDFDIGRWKTHTSRMLHPLTGSTEWVEMDGETQVSKVWGGRANLAEYAADGPTGRLELLSLRMYNPQSKQWNLNFARPDSGVLSVPMVGEFTDGRGEFYDQEDFNGRSILVRFRMWPITGDTAQSEQAFSKDGGKTWETNWINRYTRVKE